MFFQNCEVEFQKLKFPIVQHHKPEANFLAGKYSPNESVVVNTAVYPSDLPAS